jgi:hypothetical protein
VVLKGPVARVAEEIIGGAIACVEVGNGIAVLIESLVIGVKAKVDVEATVTIVISNGGVSEGSLRRACESECIFLWRELAFSIVHKEQRTGGTDNQQILKSAILEIGEERAS